MVDMDNAINHLAQWVKNRLGGYRHRLKHVDSSLPVTGKKDKSVAVIGAGLAGLRAACLLAERNFRVSLYDKNTYLGGKIGAWQVTLTDGTTMGVEHGFHAFFRHYYNLNRFLDQLGITKAFRSIEDYLVLTRQGHTYSFKNIQTTPVMNIFSMMQKKVFTPTDILFNPRLYALAALLQYHPEKTFEKYDQTSFEEFSRQVHLPEGLQLTFNSFARAFFAPPAKMSMAEVIKSFHFYFLSNDCGLLYDYPDDDYHLTLLEPIRTHLTRHGAEIILNKTIKSIRPLVKGYSVANRKFDYVVLATDVKGTRSIAQHSKSLSQRFPTLCTRLSNLKASNPYAVLRLWTDLDLGEDLPGFIITEHDRLLDSISFYHRLEKSSTDWAKTHSGGIYELHSYAVPETLTSNAKIRKHFLEELSEYFPAARSMQIFDEHLQVREDFTALHTGMYAFRPTVETEAAGLFLAGDWVKLPRPAMLMEAACMSGVLAANGILCSERLREEEVFSVPPQGILSRQ